MTLFIIGIIFIIIGCAAAAGGVGLILWRVKVNKATKEINIALEQKHSELQAICLSEEQQKTQLEKENAILSTQANNLSSQIDGLLQERTKLTNEKMQLLADNMKKVAEAAKINQENIERIRQAFAAFSDTIDDSYTEKEKTYDENVARLQDAYANEQERLSKELAAAKVSGDEQLAQMQKDIDLLKESRRIAMDAARREEEVKKQKEFYSLQISEADLNDIKMLEAIKARLNKPRVLSMLIWTTWFRTPMTQLCNNVLGTSTVTGIYKLTNQTNGMVYIGQAADIADRWKQHAKCGLDIDCPAGNKLYTAMKQDGVWNFTWELVEACPREVLNEKEKFYIDLYDSKNYGYNSTIGNK